MDRLTCTLTHCGKTFSADDLATIRELVSTCQNLSQYELAETICELLDWRRPNGRAKTRECYDLLRKLESNNHVKLPAKKAGRPPGKSTSVTRGGSPYEHPVTAKLADVLPITLECVKPEDRHRWRDLIECHHYLGCKTPFGANLQYFFYVQYCGERTLAGCMQFSSPAWRIGDRDRWIGWTDNERKKNLQKIVCQSRFLILPHFRIRNLASNILSLASRSIISDWESRYSIRPVMLESLVDAKKYSGVSYRAANWIEVGETTGRGRMDKDHKADVNRKRIFLYPLTKTFRESLTEGD